MFARDVSESRIEVQTHFASCAKLMRESNLQKQIINHLRSQGDYVFNVVGSPRQQKGTPDLLVCHNGLFLALELKISTGVESAMQLLQRRLITNAGGIAEVVRSIPDLESILRSADEEIRSPIREI